MDITNSESFVGKPSDFAWLDLSDLKVEPLKFIPKPLQDYQSKPEPKDEKPTIQDMFEAIDQIVKLLPQKDLWPISENNGETDYPTLKKEQLVEIGSNKSPITKRHIWVIGGFMFFNRYTDDIYILVGYFKDNLPCPFWDPAFKPRENILALLDLIKQNDPKMITREQVRKLLRNDCEIPL